MGRSHVGWAVNTVAPWVLASGLVVSITADAGVDASAGYQVLPLTTRSATVPDALVPHTGAALLTVSPRFAPGMIQTVRLPTGDPEPGTLVPATPPRGVLKSSAGTFPTVDRTAKGDLIVTLRETITRGPDVTPGARLLQPNLALLPPTVMMPSSEFPSAESVARFQPVPSADATTPGAAGGASSPSAGSSQLTAATRASGTSTSGVGSTPSVPRAIALSSTTPAPADATPVEIAAAPVSEQGLAALRAKGVATGGMSIIPKADDDRPSYASLIDPENLNKEERCLAEAVYFEARSEPEDGQAAVAQVVLNRVKSGLYPTSVCGVVYQNRHRKFACQFSFACEGKSLRINESDSWKTAVRVAREVTFGQTYNEDVGTATHYHANYVRPFWAKRLKKMDMIGRHIFYSLRPGQT